MWLFVCSILQQIPLFDVEMQDSSGSQDVSIQAGLKILQVENTWLVIFKFDKKSHKWGHGSITETHGH